MARIVRRTLNEIPVSIQLWENIRLRGADLTKGMLRDITRIVGKTWERSTRRVGGYWFAECEWDGPTWEMEEIFVNGLMKEIREVSGSNVNWAGFIAKMVLTKNGQQYERDWSEIFNHVRVSYTKVSPNQFTDGGAEAAGTFGSTYWVDYQSPDTTTQSSDWQVEGEYSCYIQHDGNQITNWSVEDAAPAWADIGTPTTNTRTNAYSWTYEGDYCQHIVTDDTDEGATIDATGLTISANTYYKCWIRADIISGTWRLEVYRTDTGVNLYTTSEGTTGEQTIKVTVSDTNTYAGNIGVRVTCQSASGEAYFDGCEFWEYEQGAFPGVTIESGIEIDSDLDYECSVSCNIVEGDWRLQVYRTDTDAILAESEYNSDGLVAMRTAINADSNSYDGDVGVRVVLVTARGEVYLDNAVFRIASYRCDTPWYPPESFSGLTTDPKIQLYLRAKGSQAEFGRIDEIFLEGGLSDVAAENLALTQLRLNSWPKIVPKDISTMKTGRDDGLKISLYGYVSHLQTKYTAVTGDTTIDSAITNILAEFDTIDEAVSNESNSSEITIDDRMPLRAWSVLSTIIQSGDASGNIWEGGVDQDREFYYRQMDTSYVASILNGNITNTNCTPIVDPWNIRPGYVQLLDLSYTPGRYSVAELDDPRAFLAEEVTFDLGAWLKGYTGIKFERETRRS